MKCNSVLQTNECNLNCGWNSREAISLKFDQYIVMPADILSFRNILEVDVSVSCKTLDSPLQYSEKSNETSLLQIF